jgi:GntR family transcriptional regulator/MocR family aminotransferase
VAAPTEIYTLVQKVGHSSLGAMPSPIVPFAPDIPDINNFPTTIWSRLTAMTLREMPTTLLDYPQPQGYGPLRQAIADHLRVTRGVRVSSDQVLITNGTRHALNLLLPLLANPGQLIWVEDPGYQGIRDAALLARLNVKGIPVYGDGIKWDCQTEPPTAIYVTPSHQYPLGVTMSASKRQALVDWAQHNNVWILEDDYDSEYRYHGYPLVSLHSIDRGGRVIYLGTFSKVLAPMLRLGFAVIPEPLIEASVRLRQIWDHGHSTLDQVVLSHFLAQGFYARHLKKMGTLYVKRRQHLLQMVRQYWPRISIAPSDGGLHVVALLPRHTSDTVVSYELHKQGIVALPLSRYTISRQIEPGLILNYAAYTEEATDKAVIAASTILNRL